MSTNFFVVVEKMLYVCHEILGAGYSRKEGVGSLHLAVAAAWACRNFGNSIYMGIEKLKRYIYA